MLDFVLIADGGGTKTKATGIRLVDGASFETRSGACVPSADMPLAVRSLTDVTAAALDLAGLEPQRTRVGLSLASAGLDVPDVRQRFVNAIASQYAALKVVSDGAAALDACVADGQGAVVAVGTGVVTTVRTLKGAVHTIDGWGWPCGDRGGGASIGRSAIELFLQAFDFNAIGHNLLYQKLSAQLGFDRTSIVKWLVQAQRNDFAAIARLVVECGRQGDTIATQILRNAAYQIETTSQHLSEQYSIDVLNVTGGLAESLMSYLDPQRFHHFPEATFAGAALGAAEWVGDLASANIRRIVQ